MAGAYDDREGFIWLDGKLVNWRDANVHILTHAMHYASSVFEGERAYEGKIFESRRHSERLHASAGMIDFEIPWTVDEIEAAKYQVLHANGQTDAYVRAVAWRGAGEDMGVASARNPVRLAIATWEWGPITATPRRAAPSSIFPNGSGPAPRRFRATPKRRGFT